MKYAKGDCRIGRNAPCFAHEHLMTVGPRQVKQEPQFGTRENRAYHAAEPPHRHERRAIGATFRAKYGKAEFLAMRGRVGARSSRNIAAAMLARFETDRKEGERKKVALTSAGKRAGVIS